VPVSTRRLQTDVCCLADRDEWTSLGSQPLPAAPPTYSAHLWSRAQHRLNHVTLW
jgi:hypothetical protein